MSGKELANSSRNHGIDALRILSMLMIVMLHVIGHGGIIKTSESINYWIILLFSNRGLLWCELLCLNIRICWSLFKL